MLKRVAARRMVRTREIGVVALTAAQLSRDRRALTRGAEVFTYPSRMRSTGIHRFVHLIHKSSALSAAAKQVDHVPFGRGTGDVGEQSSPSVNRALGACREVERIPAPIHARQIHHCRIEPRRERWQQARTNRRRQPHCSHARPQSKRLHRADYRAAQERVFGARSQRHCPPRQASRWRAYVLESSAPTRACCRAMVSAYRSRDDLARHRASTSDSVCGTSGRN